MSRDENPHRDNELDYSSFDGFHAQLEYKITNVRKKWGETLVGRNVVISECLDCTHYFCHTTSKLDDSLQHRNISYNAQQFNVQLERLYCKAIRRNTTPFVCTLHHSTLRWAISRKLYCLYIRCTILHYAESFSATYTVCAYAVLFDITLSHFTQRFTVFVLCCKWMPC